jgi:hypothetical protein
VPLTKPTTGIQGTCLATCAAGGPPTQCPQNSTCASSSVVGSDCQP